MTNFEKKGTYISILGVAFSIIIFIINKYYYIPEKVPNKINSYQIEYNYYTNEIFHHIETLKEKNLITKLNKKTKSLDKFEPMDTFEYINLYKEYIFIMKNTSRNARNLANLALTIVENTKPITDNLNTYLTYKYNDKKIDLINNYAKSVKKVFDSAIILNKNIKNIDEKTNDIEIAIKNYINAKKEIEKKYTNIQKINTELIVEEVKIVKIIGSILYDESYGLGNPDKTFFHLIRDVGNNTESITKNYSELLNIQYEFINNKENTLNNIYFILIILTFIFLFVIFFIKRIDLNEKKNSNSYKVIIYEQP